MTKIDIVPKHSIQSQPRPRSQRDKEAQAPGIQMRTRKEMQTSKGGGQTGWGPEGPQNFLYQDIFERHLSEEE